MKYLNTITAYLPATARIADFQATLAEGVYTFDVNLTNGLVMQKADGAAFGGGWTVTWRRGW